MRLGGRLAAAIEIIDDIEKKQRPAADMIRDWGLAHRFAGSGDRAAIGNFVYDTLRRRSMAGWLFNNNEPRALVLGAYLLENKLTVSDLDEVLASDSFAPEALSDEERSILEVRLGQVAPDEVRSGVPDWCISKIKQSFGDVWVAEAEAFAERPPLDLRVNSLKAEYDKVLASLAKTGAFKAQIASAGMRVPPISSNGRHPNVQSESAFEKGWFEVQDEGSQIVAELAGAKPGMQVLDYCAGGGGKSLAFSAMMENKGQIFAYDSDKQRLSPIHARLKRAGSRNIQVISDENKLAQMEGQFDLVVVDAPCTGSGTWRRRPDAKWRLTDQQLETRCAEQAAILDKVIGFVRPGGRLVYITCSIFDEENGAQADAFLQRHPEFERSDHDEIWSEHFSSDKEGRFAPNHNSISLTPATSGTDGFFFVSFAKQERTDAL